jgi:hypothetical protein
LTRTPIKDPCPSTTKKIRRVSDRKTNFVRVCLLKENYIEVNEQNIDDVIEMLLNTKS